MSGDEPHSWRALEQQLAAHRSAGRKIVTTNGCFDVIHAGHLSLLEGARALGDVLVVGINSDASVRRLKGADRPKMNAADRVRLLSALRPVDHVVVFDDDLPLAFLERVRPQVHVKGGDYDGEHLPETALVKAQGGVVRILPLLEGRASSVAMVPDGVAASSAGRPLLLDCLRWANVVRQTGYRLAERIAAEGAELHQRLAAGRQILVAGNGGSACDADHLAAELIGRFRRTRDGAPVISLVSGPGVLTSLSNDHGYDQVFARQVVAFGRPGDALIVISTSGKSPNVLAALEVAQARGLRSVLLTGQSGGPARALADVVFDIPSDDTVEIQQGHRAVIHALCERIDGLLAGESPS